VSGHGCGSAKAGILLSWDRLPVLERSSEADDLLFNAFALEAEMSPSLCTCFYRIGVSQLGFY